jgi:hypothetical protein
MHRTVIIGVSIALFAGGTALFVACGGSDGSSVTVTCDGGGSNADGGGSQNGNGTEGGSTSGNPDGSTTGGGNKEGGTTGGGNEGGTTGGGTTDVDGGAPSDPGKVNCGTTTCTTSTQFCCEHFFFDGGNSQTCETLGTSCGGGGSVSNECNEAADCDGGVCCATFGGNQCQKTCGGGEHQLCRTQSECKVDGGCNVLTCTGLGEQEICGHPFGCK